MIDFGGCFIYCGHFKGPMSGITCTCTPDYRKSTKLFCRFETLLLFCKTDPELINQAIS